MITFTFIEFSPVWPEVTPGGKLMQLVVAMYIYQLVQMGLDGQSYDGCSNRLIDLSSGQAAHWFTFLCFPSFLYLRLKDPFFIILEGGC